MAIIHERYAIMNAHSVPPGSNLPQGFSWYALWYATKSLLSCVEMVQIFALHLLTSVQGGFGLNRRPIRNGKDSKAKSFILLIFRHLSLVCLPR